MPYETPNGCVYDSGDYSRMLDIGLELVDYRNVAARRSEAAARGQAAGSRDRLHARQRNEQLWPVADDQPRASVLGQQRGRDRQARHLRRDRRHARHDAAGPGPRDDGRSGRRRHPQLLGRRRARACGARLLLELARRLLRHLRVAVRGHRAQRGEGRHRPARSRDQEARRRGLRRCARGGARAGRRRRPHQGESGCVPALHGLRRDHQREQRRPAGGPRRHAQLPLRLPAAVPGARHRAQVRQPDADVRDADPRRGDRDRPGDGRVRHRRLRRRRRLRQPHQPADRRGPGDGRDGTCARRRDPRALRLRRRRQPADPELLRLPRPARDRHAAAQDRCHREPVAVHAARHEGDGRGRRRRRSTPSAPPCRTRCAGTATRSSPTAATPTTASGSCSSSPQRQAAASSVVDA